MVESNLVDGKVDDLRQSKRRRTTMMTKERRYGNFSLLTSFGLLLLFLCQQVSLAAVHHQRISGNILYSSSFRSSSYCRVLQNVLLFTLGGSRFPAETVWGLSTLSYNVLLISSHSSSLQIWGREEDTSWRFGLVLQSAWAELAYDTLECLTSIVIKKCWMREGTKKPLYHALGKNSCAGSAGDVLEDNPVGRLKVFVYELPRWAESHIDDFCLQINVDWTSKSLHRNARGCKRFRGSDWSPLHQRLWTWQLNCVCYCAPFCVTGVHHLYGSLVRSSWLSEALVFNW